MDKSRDLPPLFLPKKRGCTRVARKQSKKSNKYKDFLASSMADRTTASIDNESESILAFLFFLFRSANSLGAAPAFMIPFISCSLQCSGSFYKYLSVGFAPIRFYAFFLCLCTIFALLHTILFENQKTD